MSDMHTRAMFVLEQYFAKASKRFCYMYICTNFKLKYPNELLKKKFCATCKFEYLKFKAIEWSYGKNQEYHICIL